MLALSVIIGLLSGIAAALLKNLTHFVELKSKSWLLGDQSSELTFLLPLGGIMEDTDLIIERDMAGFSWNTC